MALPTMAFDPADGFRNEVTYADPVDTAAARDQVQDGLDQIRDFINDDLKPALASTSNGEGASCIGIEDSANRFTATNVEAALAELAGSGRTTETVKANADSIAAHTATTSYIAPTLLNSWVNYGGTLATAGYLKDAHGFVHITGVIKSGTTTAGTVLFTLPVGYRPAKQEMFLANIFSGASVGLLDIDASGNVNFQAGSNTIFSLCGIIFKAA